MRLSRDPNPGHIANLEKEALRSRIAKLKAENDALLSALKAAHDAGELGGWEDCPEGDYCLCCEAWRKARSLRDAAIKQAESH